MINLDFPPKDLPPPKNKLVNRKLTDFFASSLSPSPTSSFPLPSSLSISSSKAPATASTISNTFRQSASSSRPVTRASKAAAERHSFPGTSSSNFANSLTLLPPTHPHSGPPSPRQTCSASAMATRSSLKRARSPDNHLSASHIVNTPPKLKPPNKRMKKFESNSESEPPQGVIYVTSPFSSPRKPLARHPLSSATPNRSASIQGLAASQSPNPVASPSDSSKQVVYSSQSDEMELVLPVLESSDRGKVKEDVQRWRHKTFEYSGSLLSQALDDTIDLVPLPPSPSRFSPAASVGGPSPHSDATAHIRSVTTSDSSTVLSETPFLPAMCLPSPPDTTEAPPLPPTPQPLDKESKTAKLIADIKARAYAANHFSNDEKPLQFRELENSDDDDLDDDILPSGKGKGKRNDVFSSPLSSLPPSVKGVTFGCRSPQVSPSRPTRVSERRRKPNPSSRLPTTIAEPSASVSASTLRSAPRRKKAQAPNPLDVLLREKRNADRRGTNFAALCLAEAAVEEGSRETSVDSGDNFYETGFSRLDLADEQAAWKAVQEPSPRKSSSPFGGGSDSGDIVLGARGTKILGPTAGEAINKILAGDKNTEGKENAQIAEREKALGVPLWTSPSDGDMEVDSRPTPANMSFEDGSPIFTRLEQLHNSGDDSQLILLLSSGILGVMPAEIVSSNVSRLLSFALFSYSQLADAAYLALRDVWKLRTAKVQLPFFAIASTLARLGARPSIFEELGWPTDASAQKSHFTPDSRVTAVKGLLEIVKAAAQAGAFPSDEIPDVVLSLVLIGLDISTSNDLRIHLNMTMDAVCNHDVQDLVVHSAIHEKVLKFARGLNAVNKARLVSFFGSGGGRTRHIAQWLAYGVLIPTSIKLTEQLPPLDRLILLLSPEPGSGELFDVTCETTDYEDLGHYVTILAVALADIAPYVGEERIITHSTSITQVEGSPSRARKPVLPLELLRRVLEVAQGRIIDTRAAHLDRSRTKAAMQRLTMSIYYERLAIKGVSSRGRTSTLQAYFRHDANRLVTCAPRNAS
ncbi:hypothetical protein BDN67DRAFT_770368 [Paxillus ammoniavirescens]|nr:hypothetical protein BDN67DRAFT_770368 [Paxillus ammoniavirescens]